MKVLDLHCENHHVFEGWFASEEDFISQRERGLVQCPVCSNSVVTKKLSAPRLNLSNARAEASTPDLQVSQEVSVQAGGARQLPRELLDAWMQIARKIVDNTTDVGTDFAREARKMHYGEADTRAIRGHTTLVEARELIEEGIEVMPLPLPEYLKETLQ